MKSNAERSFSYQDNRMFPERSDCCWNLMQCHDDSPKEALRQTMLSQENIFRKQVQELHRLYQIQMILMKSSGFKEVTSTQPMNYCKPEQVGNWSRCTQMPLDLEAPASCYVNYPDEHFLKKGNGWGTSEKPLPVEYYFPGETESSLEEVKLSLSIGGDISQKRSGTKNWGEKLSSIPSQQIIDLEESTETVLSVDVKGKSALGCAPCSAHFADQNGFHSSCSCTTGMKKDLSNWTKRPHSYESATRLEQNSLKQAVKKQFADPSGMGICVGKAFTSHEVACLDLNKPLVDESSFHLKDYIMVHSSEGASSDVSEGLVGEFHEGTPPDLSSCRKPNVNCSNEVSTLLQHDTLNSVVMASNSTDSSTNMNESKLQSIDLESCCMSASDRGEDHDGLTMNSQHKNAELVSKFSSRNSKDVTMAEVNDQMAEEVTGPSDLGRSGDTVEDVNTDRSPTSSKSDHIATDPSSSLKTMQSGTHLEKSYSRLNSFQNSESSQVESSGTGESKSRSPDEKEGGSPHYDALIQKGAVSLMYFSLESSRRREHDCISEVEKTDIIEKVKRDQPECSLDSFESIVLKLPESNGDDYSVTSNPYEVNDMDKKDSGIKLRRGRRLKDFQKDILPGMASLSRHEICEDIRIMEGVIRSREYKRLRSKMTNGQNWFTPVRSRRSRLNYTGRRCYK